MVAVKFCFAEVKIRGWKEAARPVQVQLLVLRDVTSCDLPCREKKDAAPDKVIGDECGLVYLRLKHAAFILRGFGSVAVRTWNKKSFPSSMQNLDSVAVSVRLNGCLVRLNSV